MKNVVPGVWFGTWTVNAPFSLVTTTAGSWFPWPSNTATVARTLAASVGSTPTVRVPVNAVPATGVTEYQSASVGLLRLPVAVNAVVRDRLLNPSGWPAHWASLFHQP